MLKEKLLSKDSFFISIPVIFIPPAIKIENHFINLQPNILLSYIEGEIKTKVRAMGKDASKKYKIGNGAPFVVKTGWAKKRSKKNMSPT